MAGVKFETREDWQEALAEAEDRVTETQAAVRRAEHEEREAKRALDAFDREHKLRASVAHPALDRMLADAEARLQVAASDLRAHLCVTAGSERADALRELEALYVMSRPEFGRWLHELLDAPAPAGHTGLLQVSDEEVAEGRAALKRQLADAHERVEAARVENEAANHELSRLR